MGDPVRDKKKPPLMTDTESDFVGWDAEILDHYPHRGLIQFADRIQLIRWHRFLREPQNPDEVQFVERVIVELEETYIADVEPKTEFDVEVSAKPLDDELLHSVGEIVAEAVFDSDAQAAEALSDLLENFEEGD